MWSLLALLHRGERRGAALPARRHDLRDRRGDRLRLDRRGTAAGAISRSPGRSGRSASLGLFGYHALYFTALRNAPPVEAGLIAYLWPLLIVVFSALLPGRAAALVPPRRRAARPRRHGADRHQGRTRRLRAGLCAGLCGGARLRHHLVGLFDPVAPLPRRADRRGRRLLPRDLAAVGASRTCSSRRRSGRPTRDAMARRAGAGPDAGRRGLLRLGPWREARRHPAPRRGELSRAAPLDADPSDRRRLLAALPCARRRRRLRAADRRRRGWGRRWIVLRRAVRRCETRLER